MPVNRDQTNSQAEQPLLMSTCTYPVSEEAADRTKTNYFAVTLLGVLLEQAMLSVTPEEI